MIGEMVGSYRIVGQLGKGGMGVVYAAEHPLLRRRAVVKMLLPELCERREMVERFFNEARASTLIAHPGIVDIFDFGFHATGSAYISMEFLDGETLAARVRRRGRLTTAEATEISRQVASVLAEAHRSGIVHRDLKPDNLFLIADPGVPGGERVKVLDFGIAKLIGANGDGHRTSSGVVMGTPLYMAPEQCVSAAQVDARADVYALGCILFELITGRPPFLGQSIAQLVAAHMFELPPLVSSIVPSVDASVEASVARSLAKSPADRQQSMADLAAELGDAGAEAVRRPMHGPMELGIATTLPAPSAPRFASTTMGTSAAEVIPQRIPPRRRRAATIAVLATAATLVAAALGLGRLGSTNLVSLDAPASPPEAESPTVDAGIQVAAIMDASVDGSVDAPAVETSEATTSVPKRPPRAVSHRKQTPPVATEVAPPAVVDHTPSPPPDPPPTPTNKVRRVRTLDLDGDGIPDER